MKRFFNFLHHLSIPSHRNNHRARALHPDFLVVLLGIVTVFSLTTGWLNSTGVLGFSKDIRAEVLYELTNQERTSQGITPLRYNDALARAAQNKANHMFANDYWAHFGAGKSPWDFILDADYSYSVAGENLAKGFLFSEGVIEGWKASPTHYANIVRPEYDEVGFAVMNGVLQGEEVTLVVQMFGAQLADSSLPGDSNVDIAYAAETSQESESKEAIEVAGTTENSGDDSSGGTSASETAPELESSGVATNKPAKSAGNNIANSLAQQGVAPAIINSFISMETLTFDWAAIVIVFLLAVLFLDLYFAHKLELIRLTGKNIAHIIFLASLIVGLMIIKSGVVLGL